MTQRHALVLTLKKELKAQGKTYADVAEWLQLSKASVKRLFAEENFTLERLECICQRLALELSDLVTQMAQAQQSMTELNETQEREIASDLLLLLVAVCVINGLGFQDILQRYRITEVECIQKLVQLDRLGIIELLPGNRIKLRVAGNFNWLPNGPIQQFFHRRIQQDFFDSRFDKPHEKLLVLNGLLSKQSNLEFQHRIQRLANEFEQLKREDGLLPVADRQGTTVVLALREWQYSLFDAYRKL